METKKGFTLWFTGIPSSGKTTLAQKVGEELKKHLLKIEHLDDDLLIENFYSDSLSGKEDKDTYINRIGFICRLLTKNNIITIVSANSPSRQIRDKNRELIGRFIEIYTKCPIETCVLRDTKGLYKKALRGEIKNLTGISDTYEEPFYPEISIDTEEETVENSTSKILKYLEDNNYIPKPQKSTEKSNQQFYTKEEEEKIKKRLAELEYV